jgi:GlpG protein
MRCIGQLPDESQARRLSDYLYVQGIENTLETPASGGWNIWVHDETHLLRAKNVLAEFTSQPDHPQYQEAPRQAAQQRAQAQHEQRAYQKQYLTKDRIFPGGIRSIGRLTLVLIVLSVIITAICGLGRNYTALRYFIISEYWAPGLGWEWYRTLIQIAHGQIWRLFTPMFIHFGILHIVFNMLWLRDLGTMIEKQQSSWILGIFVLVSAALSNLAQYAFSGPMFGGMSGVVYGLLGYIWIRSKTDPYSGLYLNQQTVVMMLAWFVLGFTGFIGNIANLAHGAGLLVGVVWGFISGRLAKRPYRRN